jgi:hypothetical protein
LEALICISFQYSYQMLQGSKQGISLQLSLI